MTAPAKAPDHATAGQRVSAELLNFTASYDQRQLEYHDATGGGIDKAVFARADLRAALAENDRLRAELATRTQERDKARGRDENLLSFAVFVWKWCNRPNVTDAERVSMIRHHPTLKAEIEPPDDGYRMGLAARTQEASHD